MEICQWGMGSCWQAWAATNERHVPSSRIAQFWRTLDERLRVLCKGETDQPQQWKRTGKVPFTISTLFPWETFIGTYLLYLFILIIMIINIIIQHVVVIKKYLLRLNQWRQWSSYFFGDPPQGFVLWEPLGQCSKYMADNQIFLVYYYI